MLMYLVFHFTKIISALQVEGINYTKVNWDLNDVHPKG